MLSLFKPLVDIAFFKCGPEILPKNSAYAVVVLIAYSLVTAVAFTLSRLPFAQLLPSILLSFCAYALLAYVLLSLSNKQERVQQTFVALVGSDMVVTLFILPAVFLLTNYSPQSLAFQLGQLSYILGLIWSVAVIAMILNAALEWKVIYGFFSAPAFFFTLVLLGQLMFRTTN